MTTRVLTGSKQEIARKLVDIDGDVREAIVFVEDRAGAIAPSEGSSGGDIFAEMEPYTVSVGHVVDYSREAIYTRKNGE